MLWLPAQGVPDFLIGLVLAERVNRPDGGGNPADQGDLQDEADKSGERSADGEELDPGEQDREDQAHVMFLVRRV